MPFPIHLFKMKNAKCKMESAKVTVGSTEDPELRTFES